MQSTVIKIGAGLLLLAVFWYLFAPQPSTAPTLVSQTESVTTDVETVSQESEVEGGLETTSDPLVVDTDVSPGEIILTGTFMGLLESEPNQDNKTFQYLLLNDGTEIIRIDLRPLIGRDKLDIEDKLGVVRGDVIKVQGSVSGGTGQFVPTSIRHNDELLEAE